MNKVDKIMNIVASVLTIVTSIMSAGLFGVSVFAPDSVKDFGREVGNWTPLPNGGGYGTEIIPDQAAIYYFATVLFAVGMAALFTFFYYRLSYLNDRALVAGGTERRWMYAAMGGLFLILFLVFQLELPKSIFFAQQLQDLALLKPLLAFAYSSIGGVVMGVATFILAAGFAALYFILFIVVPRRAKERKLESAWRM